MKQKFIDLYLRIAKECSQMSYAQRLKVGAVLVKDDNILSFSWNGTPAGWDNTCEDENNVTKDEVIHAEENVIAKAAKYGGVGTQGSTMFITHAPCSKCARGMIQAGVSAVYYLDEYRGTQGIDFLKRGGVQVIKVNADSRNRLLTNDT